MPREVVWKGMTIQTGIFKEPVDGPVAISKLNLAGDKQADLTVHGGSEKAVYAMEVEKTVADDPSVEITLVNRENSFLFTSDSKTRKTAAKNQYPLP